MVAGSVIRRVGVVVLLVVGVGLGSSGRTGPSRPRPRVERLPGVRLGGWCVVPWRSAPRKRLRSWLRRSSDFLRGSAPIGRVGGSRGDSAVVAVLASTSPGAGRLGRSSAAPGCRHHCSRQHTLSPILPIGLGSSATPIAAGYSPGMLLTGVSRAIHQGSARRVGQAVTLISSCISAETPVSECVETTTKKWPRDAGTSGAVDGSGDS